MHNPIRQASIQGWPLAAAASATWALGLVGVLCEVFERSEPLILVARFLFATATCTTLCLALIPKGAHRAELVVLARLISRGTYALLYSLALVRAGLHLWTPARSLEDFQFYIAACAVPLWVIRAIVLGYPCTDSNKGAGGKVGACIAPGHAQVGVDCHSARGVGGTGAHCAAQL